MYGAGSIGRGFIGALLSQSGYEVAFIDIDQELIDGLNREKGYPVRIVSNEGERDQWIDNVRGINGRDTEAVSAAIARAQVMATAVGVHILPRIAPILASGIQKRWELGIEAPLNILICENLLDAHHYLRGLIEKELSRAEQMRFADSVGLVETSIGRMVPVMTEEMRRENPLMVCVEPYDQLPVDRDGFIGEIPAIVNLKPWAPFNFYIQRKLYMHNMGHAAAAYFGYLAGCPTIWEAVSDPVIKVLLLRAYGEASVAMAKEHGVLAETLLDHADNLLYRFGNHRLGDTVARVGRDPVRKLSPQDRLSGTVRLCLKHGKIPYYIAAAIGAGYHYAPKDDPAAAEIQEGIGRSGIRAAVHKFSGIDAGPAQDLVVQVYEACVQGISVQDLLRRIENIKNYAYQDF